MELSDLRREFGKYSLEEEKLPASPLPMFNYWLEKAKNAGINEFNAMVLSTVGKQGRPSSRIVLLKEVSPSGRLIFYSNYSSKKGRDLDLNPFAALLFFWRTLERQIRIEGFIEKLSKKKSDNYFYSRPPESQISAIVSAQSETIESLADLKNKREKLLKMPANIKRPENWGGYELKPEMFEFWQGGKHRMHDRIRYRLKKGDWKMDRLAP